MAELQEEVQVDARVAHAAVARPCSSHSFPGFVRNVSTLPHAKYSNRCGQVCSSAGVCRWYPACLHAKIGLICFLRSHHMCVQPVCNVHLHHNTYIRENEHACIMLGRVLYVISRAQHGDSWPERSVQAQLTCQERLLPGYLWTNASFACMQWDPSPHA